MRVSKTVVFKPFSNLMSNHEVSGVVNWYDLADVDCSDSYKNDYELNTGFKITS